ncbi:MAG: carboxypeptidase T [Limisphaerales bacterium]|jgi:carboxypeptidase T
MNNNISVILLAGFVFLCSLAFSQSNIQSNIQHKHNHSSSSYEQINRDYARVRVLTGSSGMLTLQQLGIAVDHGMVKQDSWFMSDLSTEEIELIREAGLSVEILIEDVESFYASQSNNNSVRKQADCTLPAMRAPTDYIPPANWTAGSMGGFFTLDEVLARLDAMAINYPALVSAKTATGAIPTHEGRTQWQVKISDNVATDEVAEPNVLYTSLIHAREPAGMMAVLFYMEWILENYGTDPYATYVINNTQMYFVPVVNPDGYEINRTTNPSGGGLWRKNARDNGSTLGVDLNRNWPYEWNFDNLGSSGSAGSDIFRGPSPASEPETANLINLALDRNFRTALNYHSFGDYLIFPWGYDVGIFTPDNLLYRAASKQMVRDNLYDWGTAFQTVGYAANGVTDDWFYGEQTATKDKTFAWSPEVGYWFWPSPVDITFFGQENVWQNLVLAWLATQYAGVTLRTPEMLSDATGMIPFTVRGMGIEPVDAQIEVRSITPGFEIDFASASYTGLSVGVIHESAFEYKVADWIRPGTELTYEIIIRFNDAEFSQTGSTLAGAQQMNKLFVKSIRSDWTQTSFNDEESLAAEKMDGFTSNYDNNAVHVLDLGTTDLSNAEFARLVFDARWDIERNFDYAVIEASTDEQNWIPLCGNHTRTSTPWQMSGQTESNPIYDGKSDWVEESIALDDFVGAEINLRVRLVTDEAVLGQGMDIGEINIQQIGKIEPSIQQTLEAGNAFPNPGSDIIYIQLNGVSNLNLAVFDLAGKLVYQAEVSGDLVVIPVANWTSGLYRYTLQSADANLAGTFAVQ